MEERFAIVTGGRGYYRGLYTVVAISLDTSGWPNVNDSQAHLHMCV
jgi:hypothetical protein